MSSAPSIGWCRPGFRTSGGVRGVGWATTEGLGSPPEKGKHALDDPTKARQNIVLEGTQARGGGGGGGGTCDGVYGGERRGTCEVAVLERRKAAFDRQGGGSHHV
mmetsp:Transcript_29596/g.58645  ORF Transcript_29596/g.58645 Transcript_29596/m.58645 type:complete len:105 (+) Transcript_29596:161-475(+)